VALRLAACGLGADFYHVPVSVALRRVVGGVRKSRSERKSRLKREIMGQGEGPQGFHFGVVGNYIGVVEGKYRCSLICFSVVGGARCWCDGWKRKPACRIADPLKSTTSS
jgi:hypothetical protein